MPERHHNDLAIQRHLTDFRDLGPKGCIWGPSVPNVLLSSGLRRKSFGLAMGHVAKRHCPAVRDRCLWKYRSGYRTRTSTNSDHGNRRWPPAFNPTSNPEGRTTRTTKGPQVHSDLIYKRRSCDWWPPGGAPHDPLTTDHNAAMGAAHASVLIRTSSRGVAANEPHRNPR